LVIAWRREDLQAFRVEHVDLNDATKEEHDVSQARKFAHVDDYAVPQMFQILE
jgi:disulfide oxidoreductase YuzD